jgi:putative ABC transport system substrate-binding protein
MQFDQLKRREFITLLGGAAALPTVARAQQGDRIRRVGVLMALPADSPDARARIRMFQRELQQLGWIDGRNVQIEYRWTADHVDEIRKGAGELLMLAPDVILATG